MHAAVREAWIDYNKNLEGKLNGLYADVDGWVTTGMGNKVDPVEDALDLPWCLLPSWRPATPSEIIAAWSAVKHDPRCATGGWPYAFSKPENNIRLHDDAVHTLINSRLNLNDALLRKRFPDFEDWPADAQLAVHSMVWAMGATRLFKNFPKCCKALEKQDFAAAAAECKMTGGGGKPATGSLVTRNELNFTLLHNAADVVDAGGDIDVLVWQP